VAPGIINAMHIAQKFEGLLEIYRRLDGRKWSGQERGVDDRITYPLSNRVL
jgi:predicted aminopeptidase